MPLQPGVDGEAAGRGVHAGQVLAVVDVLRGQLVAVVPGRRGGAGILTAEGDPTKGATLVSRMIVKNECRG